MTQTLLSLAGAASHPSPLETSALIIIDAQEEYLTGALPLSGIGPAMEEIGRLLGLARAKGLPVFHIVHHGKPGGALFDPQTQGVRIIEALTPIPGETVVIKSLPNAFAGTDLHRLIGQTGRSELILCGFMTHMCISSATRAALDLGYRSTVVAAATATRDLPKASGGIIPAAMIAEATLAALSDRFAVVVPNFQAWTQGKSVSLKAGD